MLLRKRDGIALDLLDLREARCVAVGSQAGMPGRQGIGGHDGRSANVVQYLVRGVFDEAVSEIFGWKDTSIGFGVLGLSRNKGAFPMLPTLLPPHGQLQTGGLLCCQHTAAAQLGIAISQQPGQREDSLRQDDGPQVQRDGLQVGEGFQREDEGHGQRAGSQRVLVVTQLGLCQALQAAQIIQVGAPECRTHAVGQLARQDLFQQADIAGRLGHAQVGDGGRQRGLFGQTVQVQAHEVLKGDLGPNGGFFPQPSCSVGQLGRDVGVQPVGCVRQQRVGNVGQELEDHGTEAICHGFMQSRIQGWIDAGGHELASGNRILPSKGGRPTWHCRGARGRIGGLAMHGQAHAAGRVINGHLMSDRERQL